MIEFTPCPEVGCTRQASSERHIWLRSTHGPVEHARTMCPAGHWFFGPADSLIPLTTG